MDKQRQDLHRRPPRHGRFRPSCAACKPVATPMCSPPAGRSWICWTSVPCTPGCRKRPRLPLHRRRQGPVASQANNVYRAEFLYPEPHDRGQPHPWRPTSRACSADVPWLLPSTQARAPQPLEDCLLTGRSEPTNEPYAIAKIAGIKLCSYNRQYGRQYVSAMPTNLYGPNDNYDLQSSHVLPALIRKAHEAKRRGDAELVVWGTGTPLREFLYVDDLADACVHLMETGTDDILHQRRRGSDCHIRQLAETGLRVVASRQRCSTPPSPTARPQAHGREPAPAGAGAPRLGCARALRWRTRTSSAGSREAATACPGAACGDGVMKGADQARSSHERSGPSPGVWRRHLCVWAWGGGAGHPRACSWPGRVRRVCSIHAPHRCQCASQ